MPISVISKGQPIRCEAVSVVILGNPGVGKTSLANTADAPLLLAFDVKGANRALGRPDTVLVKTWADIKSMTKDDLGPYKTIVIDTIGRCLEVMAEDIMANDVKAGSAGSLSLKGFGVLKGRFRQWLAMIAGYGINVVMVAHATEERHGDEVRLRVDAQGASKEEVYKEADLMGRMTIENKLPVINWDPSDSGFGKNPGGLPKEAVPHPSASPGYLQKCIRHTMDAISADNVNANTEEERLAELRGVLDEKLKSPDDFSRMAAKMKEAGAPGGDKVVLAALAKQRGYLFDRDTVTFSAPEAEKAAADPAAAQEVPF